MSKNGKNLPKFTVIGHRGHGMNILQSTDRRMKAFKENSILSFNNAAKHPIDFIEFDVQVLIILSSLNAFDLVDELACMISSSILRLSSIMDPLHSIAYLSFNQTVEIIFLLSRNYVIDNFIRFTKIGLAMAVPASITGNKVIFSWFDYGGNIDIKCEFVVGDER